jgi:hypothetical protein
MILQVCLRFLKILKTFDVLGRSFEHLILLKLREFEIYTLIFVNNILNIYQLNYT